ncbi:MAG: HAMP domain-containing sensor histidine kinase [Oscillospiraceae bacterium]
MKTFNFENYEKVNYPCFLLDANFVIIKQNIAASQPVCNFFKTPNAFAEIVMADSENQAVLDNGATAFFKTPRFVPMQTQISIMPLENQFFVMLVPTAGSFAEPWFSGELRNRISSIFSCLPIIEKKLEDDSEANAYTENLSRNCYLLLRTTQNVSTLSKLSDKTYTKPQTINVYSILKNIVECTKEICKGKNIPIFLQETNDLFVNFNLEIFEICVSNILLNSIIYTQDENEINISLEKTENNAIITFRDKGKGIKPDALEEVFIPYFSADPYLDGEPRPGLGLGLAIVKQAVLAFGGTCTLQSRFGNGCSLCISLPLVVPSNDILASTPQSYYTNRFSTPFVQLSSVCELPHLG